MSDPDPILQPDAETLEHLLGVVVENREKRCQQVRDQAHQQAAEIIAQAYKRSRGRLHRHIVALREKSRDRVASARARNQTLLRQQHHKEERAILDVAWPMLRSTMQALWETPETRYRWIEAAVANAEQLLIQGGWHIEHPADFDREDRDRLEQMLDPDTNPGFSTSDDIEAGIRITVNGTVIDATLAGLLKQKIAIEARMIARIKHGAMSHE